MKLYGRNGRLICEPYKIAKQNSNSLIIQNTDSDNVAKIIEKVESYYPYGVNDIVLYDADKAQKCVLNGKEYIVVDEIGILAIIKENE